MKRALTIDLHGLTYNEAYLKLIETFENIPNNITRVIVVHGYHGGDILKNLVRKDFYNPKILEVGESLNQGETIYYLK